MAEMGVHSVAYAFPKVRIITTAVDKEVNDQFHIIPGIGEDPGAGSTRDPFCFERLSPPCDLLFSLPRQLWWPILWHRCAFRLVWKRRGDGLLRGDCSQDVGQMTRWREAVRKALWLSGLRLSFTSSSHIVFHCRWEVLAPPPSIQVLLHRGVGNDSVLPFLQSLQTSRSFFLHSVSVRLWPKFDLIWNRKWIEGGAAAGGDCGSFIHNGIS